MLEYSVASPRIAEQVAEEVVAASHAVGAVEAARVLEQVLDLHFVRVSARI